MEKRTKSNFLQRFAMLMALLSLTVAVQAQNNFWVNGIHYMIENNENDTYWSITPTSVQLKVVEATGNYSYSGDIVIPETVKVNVSRYDGSTYGGSYDIVCRVTAIGANAFNGCSGLTSITLPKTIKYIDDNAFYGCSGLSSITIPNGVNRIGESAFAYCTGLTSIALPNSVTELGWNAFYSCSGLRSVELSKSLTILNGTFAYCTSLTTVTVPAGVRIISTTFKGCTALTSVTLPKSMFKMGESTFEGCTSLSSIYLPDALTYIGSRAFSNTGLTSIELPDGIFSLGEDAFNGSTQLTTITSRNPNPPTMTNQGVFSEETYGTAMLYYPGFEETLYTGADWWRLFANAEGKSSLKTRYDFEASGIYYLIAGSNTVEVTYKDTNYSSYSGNVNIPASVTHDGMTYSVTTIGSSAFKGSTALTSVTLPATVTYIGSYAFEGCTGLSAIDFPEALTAIGEYAFNGCSGLTSLTIPVNVTHIGNEAFAGTNGLTSLTWNARECWTNGDMVTSGITALAIGNEVVVVPEYLAYQSAITSVNIPLTVEFIGQWAFGGCQGVTALTIPQNVVDIGPYAFTQMYGLTSLTWNALECWTNGDMYTNDINSLTIGDGVKILPSRLAYQSSISSLTIPESVTVINAYGFCNCTGLTSVTIPDNVICIGYRAFGDCSYLDELTMGKSVETLDSYAFYGAPFTTLTWNARHLSTMGYGGHDTYYHYMENSNAMDFSRMTQLTFGEEVEFLPAYFGYGAKITSVTIPEAVTTISNGTFANCADLTSVTLPPVVTSIGKKAFANCGNLAAIDLPGTVTDIGAEAFTYCKGLTSLFIPASVTSFGTRAFNNCTGLESIVVDNANPVYDSRNNCNTMLKTANDSIVLVCKNSTLPDAVTMIPDSAFFNNTGLTTLVIPSTVTYIGKDAFNGCTNLTSITIPAAVTTIGSNAFDNCRSLSTLRVEDGNTLYDSRGDCNAIIETATNTLIAGSAGTVIPSSVTTIADRAFAGRSPSAVTIPDGVVTIGNEAFMGAPLSSLVVGNTVKTIGARAFYTCGSLMDINLGNSVETICDYAFYMCMQYHPQSGFGRDGAGNYYYYWYIDYDEEFQERSYLSYDPETDMYYGEDPYHGEFIYISAQELDDIINASGSNLAIPASVQNMGSGVFQRCRGLKNLVLEPGLTSIGYEAFWECSSLQSVTIPASLKSVDYGAFHDCPNLNSVLITDLAAWCDIDFYMYSSNPLYEGHNLYLNGELVTDLVIPEGVTQIKREAFQSCYSINSVTLPSTLKSIGYEGFEQCENLKRIVIPDSVETIGDNAFRDCESLKSVTLGRSMRSIGGSAFNYCNLIDTVTSFAVTPPSTGYSPFSCYDRATLRVPQASLEAYRNAYNWKRFHIIEGMAGGAGPGDYNGDGVLNVSDVNLLINAIIGDGIDLESYPNADVNGDGQVNISDVTALIAALLNAE